MEYYLTPVKNNLGAYPAPQATRAEGMIPLTAEQVKTVVDYNGFVVITDEPDEYGAVSYTIKPDLEAWEAWKESQVEPEPEITDTDVLNTLLGVTE